MAEFDVSDLDVLYPSFADFSLPNFDLPNFGILADEHALDAFQWPAEENLMADFMSSAAPPMGEESPFQADLDIIDNIMVPSAEKQWIFDVLLNDVVPYRYHDHLRLFPDIEFYRTLLYNRCNRDEIWGLVQRFHEWISSVAASSPAEADEAIAALEHRAAFYGWSGTQEIPSYFATDTEKIRPQQQQRQVAPESIPSMCPSTAPPVQQREKARSQSLSLYEHEHPLLQAELFVMPTFEFKGLIQSMDHFTEVDDAYERHVKRAAGAVPEDDPSWPASSGKQRQYVQQLFESITDLSDFFELRKARERLGNIANAQKNPATLEDEGNPRKRRRSHSSQNVDIVPTRPKGMSKTDWALVDAESSPTDLLEAVIHHRISGVEVELLCWRLLRSAMEQQQGFTMRPLWSGTRTVSTWEHFDTFSARWTSICSNLQDCKMILHSLTRADWFCKYAGAPSKERGAKLSNDLLNGRRDIQNQVGREVIKEKTSTQDWITTDDFEIRDKAGDLVLKGGHLGDKKRRQLAMRNSEGDF
ncbi:hypothetical protein CABS01_14189 [Colletotrichum abscissum]|uniref:Uncharacterized protein n=1 Tax=Colletotrichum abscissum TaxID=1671311 RepID=A0A9P9X7C7_9PEZI|nr:uncharacterized protein CABS01_14189 [Colletotrichum abscissum]KAI3540129.1 hypothetical protein CABS02_11175 [Colletotrichum abscissum]KAK1481991.1 hypothetical protein CABS01_14189 [Colletotrichum abscissum]